MSELVATTPLGAIRPVGLEAERSLQRIKGILDLEFPLGIGIQLAVPVLLRGRSGVDWYADYDGKPVRLTDLPDETREIYRRRLRQSVQTVENAATIYRSRGDEASRSKAASLQNAVTFPGEEYVWVAGGQGGAGTIILTAWGYEPHEPGRAGGGTDEIHTKGHLDPSLDTAATEAAVAGSKEPVPALAAAPPVGRGWWRRAAMVLLWLLPLLLAGLIAWLLLPACGLRLPFGFSVFGWGSRAYCDLAAPPRPVDPASLRTRELMSEAAVLEAQLGRHLNACVRQPPQSEASRQMDEQLGQRGGHSGKLQVTLSWHTLDDLDLNVFCPGGMLGGNRDVRGPGVCGDGVKDVDSNRNLKENVSSNPVENIVWQDDVPRGNYKFEILPYMAKDGRHTSRIPFDIRFRIDGKEKICHGIATHGEGGESTIADYIYWNYGDPLPDCNFKEIETRPCTTDCKG
jgi:hypothetical protein